MKIIHFADLHLGVEAYGHVDAESGLSSRFLDFLHTFDRLIDFAIEKQVDLVLFCGDAYKSRDPSQTQQRELAKRIKKLSSRGIPVFLLVGNHDLPNAMGRASTTEIFDTLSIENVYVGSKPGVYMIPTPSGKAQVVALPWLKRSNLLASAESKKLNFPELNDKMQEVLSNIIASLSAELDPCLPSILAAHVWVQGARTGSEDTMSIGQEHMLLPSSVAMPCFDYVALGHIHRHQVLNENPPVVYSGSLERLDFGDEDDEKGFYFIELEHDAKHRWTTFEFRGLPGRRFLKISVDIEADDGFLMDTILKVMDASLNEIQNNIVRLELSLPQECDRQVDENRLRQAAAEAYHFSITKNLRRSTRPRFEGLTPESLTPCTALAAYLEMKKDEYPRKEQLQEIGLNVIKEDV